jgi:hypothetical protein
MQHPDQKRYRKTATVLGRQLAVGETEKIDTLEGPATVSGPDWRLKANNEIGEEWPVTADYFAGPNGYEETGEVVDGLKVYRKKPTAEVWAYQVDTDDHPPLPAEGGMVHLDAEFAPPRGYWVAWQLDGTHVRAIEPDVFAATYEPADEQPDRESPSAQTATRISHQDFWL